MPEVNNRVSICPNCTNLPPGIEEAEIRKVEDARREDWAEDCAGWGLYSGAASYCAATTRVTVEAMESTHAINKGDKATFTIANRGRSEDEIYQAYAECTGPRRGWLSRLFRTRGACSVGIVATGYRYIQFKDNARSKRAV